MAGASQFDYTLALAIFHASPDGIVVFDHAGRIVDLNPAAESLLKISRADLAGQQHGWRSAVSRLGGTSHKGSPALTFGTEGLPAGTWTATTATRGDGLEVPVEVFLAPLPPTESQPLVAYIRPLGRTHMPGVTPARSKPVPQISAAEHAADAIFGLDAEGRITCANPAAEATLGWRLDELTGQKMRDLAQCVCDRSGACPRQPGGSPSASGSMAVESIVEAQMTRKDGRQASVFCHYSPVLVDGAITGGSVVVRDITAGQPAQQQVAELAERLGAYFEVSPLAVVEFSPDQIITRWSPGAEHMFGWNANEVTGRNLTEFPDIQVGLNSRDLHSGEDQGSNPQPRCTESACHTKDGRIIDVRWYHSLLKDKRRQTSFVVSLGMDVTTHKSAEKLLRESEARFRSTMEQAAAGLSHVDLEGRFLRANQQFRDILGRSDDELIGHTVQEFTHPDDLPGDAVRMRSLFDGSLKFYSREKRYVRKDGETVWVLVRVSLVYDPAGKPSYVLGIVTDISMRKRAEASLRQSYDRYRFLANSMPQIVLTATPKGFVDYHNHNWFEYTGRSREATLGLEWVSALHPEDRENAMARWMVAARIERPFKVELRLRRTNGEYRWHLMEAAPMFSENGKITQWVMACTDIEDQKQAAASLESKVRERTIEAEDLARQAQEASVAKSEFLAMMSHEIRSPMNVIVGMADLLSESRLSESQREYTQVLRNAGEALLTVINDVLDLSAVEARRLEIQQTPFGLGEVLESVSSIMLPRARTKGLILNCEVVPGVPNRLIGDPHRLRQVLLNLVNNAMKFTEHGSISLRAAPSRDGAPGTVTFSVIDTGIGIPADRQDIIFEAFTQADSSTTRSYGGTGLGLTISRQLVELMKGSIWVESVPGQGSTFSFTIPFEVQTGQEPEPPKGWSGQVLAIGDNQASRLTARQTPVSHDTPNAAPAASRQPPRRILLAEDSIDNAFLVQTYLTGSQYVVSVASNGAEAVAMAKTGDYDLILMDIQMPIMDGHDATRAIRSWERENSRPRMPILALTAHALRSEVEKSTEAGCDAHLSKPIQRGFLLEKIGEYINQPKPERIVVVAPQGLEELADQYLARRRDGLVMLRKLVENQEYDQVRALAHDIKGSGTSYGFPPLTATAADLEQASMKRDLLRMERALNAMADYLRVVEVIPRPPGSDPETAS